MCDDAHMLLLQNEAGDQDAQESCVLRWTSHAPDLLAHGTARAQFADPIANKKEQWSKHFDQMSHCGGRGKGVFFTNNDVTWHQSVRSIAVSCSSHTVMPLLRTEWLLLRQTPQQRLPLLFSGPGNPQNCLLPWGILTPIWYTVPWTHMCQSPKWAHDQFSGFCTAYPCDQHTDRQTHRPRYMLQQTAIYTMNVMWPNNNKLTMLNGMINCLAVSQLNTNIKLYDTVMPC